jgi:hypothetical protein
MLLISLFSKITKKLYKANLQPAQYFSHFHLAMFQVFRKNAHILGNNKQQTTCNSII